MTFRLIIFLLCFAPFIHAQPAGALDGTFGTNGIVGHTITVDDLLHGVSVYDIHLLPGQKILAAGIAKNGCSSSSNFFGIVFRLNSDGTLDTTFNSTGYRMFYDYYFQAIIPAGNDTFYVVSNNHLLKMNGNGEPDTSFGDDGFLPVDIHAFKGAFTQDGKILLGGRKMNASAQWEVAVTRINTNGTIDTGYGNNGIFTVPHVNGASTSFGGMHIDSENRLLLVGRRQVSQNDGKIIAFRLLENGTYDTTFADGGTYFENVHYDARAQGINTTANGDILIAGNGQYGPFETQGLILIQLNNNGTPDTGFATGGRLHQPIYSESTAHVLHILEDESIVVTGGYQSTYIAKFDAQGAPVTDFGTNGVVNDFHFDWTGFNTVSILNGNRILMAANTAFAHCAQSKYEALFMRYFLDDQGISLTAFPADDLTACDTSSNNSQTASFDLTVNDANIISGQVGTTVTYHLTSNDALEGANAIEIPESFVNTVNTQIIYARIQDGMGDFDTTDFVLLVNPLPVAVEPNTLTSCDTNGDGFALFLLSDSTPEITGGAPDVSVTFHPTPATAQNNTQTLPLTYQNTVAYNQTVYARVEDTNTGCFATVALELMVNPLPVAVEPNALTSCDTNGDGFALFLLSDSTPEITGGAPDVTVTFHPTPVTAQNNTQTLPLTYQNTVAYSQTVYARVEDNNTGCFATVALELMVNPLPQVPASINPIIVCSEDSNITFDLTLRAAEIYGSQSAPDFELWYYTTQADAENNTNAIAMPEAYMNQTNPETIFIRLEDITTGCFVTASFELIIAQLYIAIMPQDIFIDEGDGDGIAVFDLRVNESLMLGSQNAGNIGFSYFESLTDAENNTNPILNAEQFVNTANPQTIFVRMEQNLTTDCYLISSFEIETDEFLSTHTPGRIQISLYPNPVKSDLYLSAAGPVEQLEVFTLSGQKLHLAISGMDNPMKKIDFSGLATGVYLVKITTNKGVAVKRVIKQ